VPEFYGQEFCLIALTFAMVYDGRNINSFLFAIYFDQLSVHLQAVRVGCRLGNLIVNHFLFANDIVIFLPLPKVCKSYSMSFLILLINTESFLMYLNHSV